MIAERPQVISIIVACAGAGAIGRGGDLLFHISDDLKRFKRLTMGKPVIMGRKTFESFPNGALPGRRNVVITRQADYSAPSVETAQSLDDALSMCAGADEVFVIGGGEIYRQALPAADRIYLTEIDAEVPDADTFMPEIDMTKWSDTEASAYMTDPRKGVRYRFVDMVSR